MRIETERLAVRGFALEDEADLHEILGDAQTMRFLEAPYDREKTQRFLAEFCIARRGAMAAQRKDSGKVIGYILLREEAPFTVYVTAQTADQAEYVVRSALERVKWLDLYGMCRIICLNPSGDPEIETIYRNLIRKYPFAEIGALQTRKDVL